MIWKIIKGLLAILLISAIALFALPWLNPVSERFGNSDRRDYLAANLVALDENDLSSGLALAPDDYAARYVLLGEMHGFAVPQRADLALVRHLQEKGPARWYLGEVTPEEAIAINTYISGGDDAAVRAVFERFADMPVQWANREFFEKLTGLRALNAGLPAERQVRFIDIDASRTAPLGVPLDTPAADTAPDLASFARADAINALLAAKSAEPGSETRYAAMQRNMGILAGLPGFAEARFMGLWGTFHASEAPINGEKTLSMWLQDSDAPYAGDVVTINFVCTSECYNMMPKAALPEPMHGSAEAEFTALPMHLDNPYVQRLKGVDDLSATMRDTGMEVALLPVSESSPYRGDSRMLTGYSGYLPLIQPWEVEGSASEMTDYFLVARSSAALTPWRGKLYDVESGEER